MRLRIKLVFAFLFLSLVPLTLCGQTYEEMWKTVEKANNKKTIDSALEEIKKIHDKAVNEKNSAQEIKAICRKYYIEHLTKGDSLEEILKSFEKTVETSNDEIKPLLKVILAKWYLIYYKSCKNEISGRDIKQKNFDLNDTKTWNLSNLYYHICYLYDSALENEKDLANIPASKYDSIIRMKKYPEELIKNIYEFLIHEALDFYHYETTRMSSPQCAYEIDADSKIFDSTDEFINWKPEFIDLDNYNIKALKLYQKLLAFNKKENNINALVYNDVERICWAKSITVGKNKFKRYISALKEIVDKEYSDNIYSPYALSLLAEHYKLTGQNQEAYNYAQLLCTKWPKSIYITSAIKIKQEISQPYISFSTDKIINSKNAKIKIDFRFMGHAYFRMIKREYDEVFYNEKIGRYDINFTNKLREKKPDYTFSIDLVATSPYEISTNYLELPELEKGFYWILASVNKEFPHYFGAIHVNSVIVSDLNVISRAQDDKDNNLFYVYNSVTGEPIEGVEYKIFDYDYDRQGGRVYKRSSHRGKTNKYGIAEYPKTYRYLLLYCSYNGNKLYTDLPFNEDNYGRGINNKINNAKKPQN